MVLLINVVRNSLTTPTSYWLFQSTFVFTESVQKYLTWPGICARHMRDKQWFLELVIKQWVEQQCITLFEHPMHLSYFLWDCPSYEGLALTTCFLLCCSRFSKWDHMNYALLQTLNCILHAWSFIYIRSFFFFLLFFTQHLVLKICPYCYIYTFFYCLLSFSSTLVCILYIFHTLFQVSSSKCMPSQITQVNILNLIPSYIYENFP